MKIFVKKSVVFEINKSLSKNKLKLEALKKEVIAILEKSESKELKKAIEYFGSMEDRYSHLEKSLEGKWIEKAGYGVGTVRIWKGKKYKKIAQNKWVRVFDKNDRGAATSMGKYIAQVKKCSSVEELYQFCMKQRSLFQDENGVDLPIMDKLKAAIDEQSGKIESGDKLNSRMKEYQKEDLAKLKAGNYSFDSFADFKAEIKKQGNDFRGSKQPNYIGYLSQYSDNYLQQVYDAMPKRESKEDNPDYPFKPKTEKERAERAAFEKDRDDFIERMDKIRQEEKQKNTEKYDDDKAYEEYQKLLMKENPTDADYSRIGELVKEHYKHSKKEWIGGKGLKELNEAKDDSKVLSNGKTVKEVREQYGIKVDEKETEKFWDGKVESDDGEGEFVAEMKGIGGGLYRNRFKTRAAAEKSVKNHQALGFESHVVEDKKEAEKETYWITDSKRNRLTNEQAKKRIINSLNENDKLAAKLNSLDAADRIAVEKDIRMNQNDIDNLMGKLNPDDRKEMESEQEKHQNRSDAMKGNQNAKKYGASMDDKEPIAKATKVADGKVTIPNDPAVKSQMKQLIALRYTDYVGNTSYGDMLSEVYYDGENLVSTDAKVLKVIKIGRLDGIEPNKYVKIDISGKDNISINQMDKKVGQYPNYKRVIPNGNDQTFAIDNKLAKEKIEAMKRDGSILKKDGKIALEFDGDAIKLDGTVIGKTYGTKLVGNDYIAIQADYILNVLGKNGEETNFNASENPQRALTVTTNVSTDVIMPMVAEKPDYEQNRKDFKEKQEFESARKEAREKEKAEQDAKRLKSESKELLIKNRPEGVSADDYSSMIDFADDYYVKLGYDNSQQMAGANIKRMIDNAIIQINNKDYGFVEMLLNSDNKVSRKIFEMLTGERVGTNKQAALRAWESWVGKEGVDAHNKKIADAEKAEKDRIAAEKKAKDDAEREQYHGFMDGKTPAGKGKAKDILEKKGNFGGKIMTYQELADKYIADGGHVSMQTYQTNSGKDKNYYYVMDKDGSGYEIPKTIYDYAKYIKDNPVKKSLADIIMLDEYEHEDFDEDYSDFDASQPDLFNSPAYKVSAALDSVFGCR